MNAPLAAPADAALLVRQIARRLRRLDPVVDAAELVALATELHALAGEPTLAVDDGVGVRAPGYRCLLRDVGPRKLAEQALRLEQSFSDSLVDAIEAVVLVVDGGGRVARSNPFVHTASGRNGAELAS